MSYIFVDCEAAGPCPRLGTMTEFGAVELESQKTFHGLIYESSPDPEIPAKPVVGKLANSPVRVFAEFEIWLAQFGRVVFVSDNPAYDYQWINDGFWVHLGRNPFGHSGRRISDYYAGLTGEWSNTQKWKRLRVTKHDHNPVHDALGNVEAFKRLQAGER